MAVGFVVQVRSHGVQGGKDFTVLLAVSGDFRPVGNVVHQLHVQIGKNAFLLGGQDAGLGQRRFKGFDGAFQGRLILYHGIGVQGFRRRPCFFHLRNSEPADGRSQERDEILISRQS